jgi:molecular chaperone HtpG
MKEMSAALSGMNFYGEMPDSYNFVVNTEHPLIKRILEDEKTQCSQEVSPISNKISELEAKRKELQGDKKESELDQATKDEIKKIDGEISESKAQKKAVFSKYSSENKEVRQLVDLALLSNNLLKGQALSAFIKRSIEMM